MKKIIQFCFTILILFGNYKSYSQGSWGSWSTMSCYKGFQGAVLTNGYVKSINQYSWQAKIKSNYSKKVTFNMSWTVGGETVSIGQVSLNPGQEYSHTSRYFNSNANRLDIQISEVCFGNNWLSCKSCFADCDNGSANQPDCGSSSQQTFNNSNQNSTYQTQQQTNSSSQQRELLAKQKSDEEFESKTGTWVEYGQKANSSAKAGDYESAVKYAKLQVSASANDAQRENAQLWLNEYTKAKQNSGGSTNGLSKTTNSNTSPSYVPNPQSVIANQDAIRAQNIANTAVAVVQLGIVAGEVIKDAKRLKLEKRELQNKLIGNENMYPEAATQYLKLKKKSKRILWSGVGVAIGGLAYTNLATRSVIDYYNYESYFTKIRIGQGIMIGGLGLSLVAIPIKIKSNSKLENAKSMVGSLVFNRNGIQFALNF
jgi:hypothetical protein